MSKDKTPKNKKKKSENRVEFSAAKFISGVSFCIILLAVVFIFAFDKISSALNLPFGKDKSDVTITQDYPLKFEDEYKNDFEMYMINCGQAEALYFKLPNGQNMLIDCGEDDTCSKYLKSKGVKKVDYLIVTHSDADHIGGAEQVFKNFEVVNCYRMYQHIYGVGGLRQGINPDRNSGSLSETSTVYYNFLVSLQEENCNSVYFNKNTDIEITIKHNDGSSDLFKLDFLTPVAERVSDIVYQKNNAFSPLILISYLNTKILITGDSETEPNEKEFLSYYSAELSNFDIDILDVAHHGSDTSTSKEFLDVLKPEFALISCGLNNPYSLPSQTVLNNLKNLIGCFVYRTDYCGTITVKIDRKYNIDGQYYIISNEYNVLPAL